MTTEQKPTTSIIHIETVEVRRSLREKGWANTARVTIERPPSSADPFVVSSPRIAMSELRNILRHADDGNGGRLFVQEDRRRSDDYGTEHGSRTFYVRGYQYPRSS